jgi:subfamily B ATP-binding cassette protein MsbA
MKTYLRLLNYARPYNFVPLYILYAVLGIVFGIANFTLIIPLLNVLFGTTDAHLKAVPTALPAFSLSLDYLRTVFDFYFAQMLSSYGKQGTLAYGCGLVVVWVAAALAGAGAGGAQPAQCALRPHHGAGAGLFLL